MKNTWKKFISIALTGALASTAFVACQPEKTSAESMVSIDVNPSVSLVLDQNDKVLSVIAENEDAQIMIYETDFSGMTVEAATKKLADLAVEYGYLSESNRGVSVTAQGEVDLSKVQEAVKNSFSQAANGEYTVNVTTDGLFSVNRELSMINEEYNLNLTVGEYELIVRAQAADKSLTVEAAANMTTEDLLEIVYTHADEFKPYMTEAYEETKKSAINAYYKAKDELLTGLYIAPYLNILNWTKYDLQNALFYQMYSANAVALEAGIFLAEAAAKAAEKVAIPETAQNAIAEKLGITEEAALAQFKEDVKGENGVVTLASLEDYLNTYFKNMTADEREAAKAKFDEVMSIAKAQAEAVYAQVDTALQGALGTTIEEIGANVDKMLGDLPAGLQTKAQMFVDEFKTTLGDLATAVQNKEPLEAAYEARDTFNVKREEKLSAIKAELSESDLKAVEATIEAVNNMLSGFETTMKNKIAQAEAKAKAWLEEQQTQRTAKAQ